MIQFFLSILLFLLTCFSVQAGEFHFGKEAVDGFGVLHTKGTTLKKIGSKPLALELSKASYLPSELFLDFESKKPSTLKDKNGNYKILSADYFVVSSKNKMGKRFASFSSKNSQIVVETNPNQLLGSHKITDTFYISLFVMTGALEQNSILFSKTYITGNKKYGVECGISDNRLVLNLYNMFYSGKTTQSITLKSPNKLKSGKWIHVAVAIEPEQARVSLFENGERKDTISLNADHNIPSFGFHKNDTSPLFIGKEFYGKMDNFFVGLGLPDFDYLNTPYKKVDYDSVNKVANQIYGEAYSDVLKTKYSHSLPIDFNYDAEVPDGTHIEVLYRFSNSIFSKDSEDIEWSNVKSFQSAEKHRFHYFQWKVLLRSDYSGKHSPILKNVSFKYVESNPPEAPVGLRVEKVKNDNLSVCLFWNSNHEDYVKENGGYIIHYGVTPDRMVASVLYDKEGKPITGLKNPGNLEKEYKALSFCIDNDTIKYNSELRKDKNLPVFQKGITYYFKVSAYNKFYNYKENTGLDQKSKLSKPVSFTFQNYSSEKN